MKNYILDASSANIVNTFIEDKLDRRKFVLRFVKLLDAIDNKATIALDGGWGTGKTFFVKQVKFVLDERANNFKNHFDLKNLAQEKISGHGIKCETMYYDAWKHDSDQDPLLSIIYNIMKSKQTPYD